MIRDIEIRYKRVFLGFVWSLVCPLLMIPNNRVD